MKNAKSLYHGHRFPAVVISCTVRWYFRFQVSQPARRHCQLKETGLTKIQFGGRFAGIETDSRANFRAFDLGDSLPTEKFSEFRQVDKDAHRTTGGHYRKTGRDKAILPSSSRHVTRHDQQADHAGHT
jgi:hypothetical protein